MAKVVVFHKVPGGGYTKRTVITGTKYIQKKKSGRLAGRKSVKGAGEKFTRKRVTKRFVLVKKNKNARGHIRSKRVTFNPGTFV